MKVCTGLRAAELVYGLVVPLPVRAVTGLARSESAAPARESPFEQVTRRLDMLAGVVLG